MKKKTNDQTTYYKVPKNKKFILIYITKSKFPDFYSLHSFLYKMLFSMLLLLNLKAYSRCRPYALLNRVKSIYNGGGGLVEEMGAVSCKQE
jgi:hypothetical protein